MKKVTLHSASGHLFEGHNNLLLLLCRVAEYEILPSEALMGVFVSNHFRLIL